MSWFGGRAVLAGPERLPEVSANRDGVRYYAAIIADKQANADMITMSRSGALGRFAPQNRTTLLCYALQAGHTGLRQKKLARRGNSYLYFDKYQLSLKYT
jgi:hypothetical protein